MTALEATPQAPMMPQPVPTHRTGLARQSWIMVKRNMIHTKRMPEMLSDVTAQPIMFVLLFAFVFGASITNTGGASYREFLLPGIQAQTIVFSAFVVASGITADVEKGIIDRFRVAAHLAVLGADRPQHRQRHPLVPGGGGDGVTGLASAGGSGTVSARPCWPSRCCCCSASG